MDFEQLLEKSKQELAELNKKEAVLAESIKQKAEALGLEVNESLADNLKRKKEELGETMKNTTAEIERLTSQLEEINLSTDEQ